MNREYKQGDRVQLHPATDFWMSGARYGEVIQCSLRMSKKKSDGTRTHQFKYKVRLDSGHTAWFKEQDIMEKVS